MGIHGLGLALAVAFTAEVAHPRFGPFLFGLALLLLAAKAGGLLAQRCGAPTVLGELLAGISLSTLLPLALGTNGIAFIRSDPALLALAEIGVLILLFDVGLETDLRALIRVGWSSALVALIGVVVPLGLGWAAAAMLLPQSPTLAHVFVGATLSATSVGITARVLKDLGKTQSREGQIILGAAVIDDVLGLLVLAVITGTIAAGPGTGATTFAFGIANIFIRALLFLGITVGLGHRLSRPILRLAARTGQPGILLVFGLALCFMLAFAAEFIGLADIIGAFAAGLMLDPFGEGVRAREEEATLSELMHPLSALFVPLFFVLIGMQVDLVSLLSGPTLLLGGTLTVCAIAGKLACAAGVLDHSVNRLAVGVGMIPRGEVGLIFAGLGATQTLAGQPLLSQDAFSSVVMMVFITTFLAPIGVRWAFARNRPNTR